MMKHLLVVIILALVMNIASQSFAAEVPVEEVVLVANVDVPATSIKEAEIESLFTGQTTKVGDVRVEIAILQAGDVHESFLKNYIKKTASQFISSWKKLVFSGKAKMPKEFEKEEDLVAYVAKTSGAIGYVHVKTSQNTAVMTDKVKLLPIEKK